jgi:hypothetical protein
MQDHPVGCEFPDRDVAIGMATTRTATAAPKINRALAAHFPKRVDMAPPRLVVSSAGDQQCR